MTTGVCHLFTIPIACRYPRAATTVTTRHLACQKRERKGFHNWKSLRLSRGKGLGCTCTRRMMKLMTRERTMGATWTGQQHREIASSGHKSLLNCTQAASTARLRQGLSRGASTSTMRVGSVQLLWKIPTKMSNSAGRSGEGRHGIRHPIPSAPKWHLGNSSITVRFKGEQLLAYIKITLHILMRKRRQRALMKIQEVSALPHKTRWKIIQGGSFSANSINPPPQITRRRGFIP